MDLNMKPEENAGSCAGDEEMVEVRENMESVVRVLGRVEKLLGGGREEEEVGDGMEEGKEEMGSDEEEGAGDLGGKGEGKENGASDMEEIEKVKDGALNRRASRRKSCQLAKEKILRLNEDSDEWEDEEIPRKGPKRKRKRKGVKSEDDGGETAGEEKNEKEESPKRRRGRRRKAWRDGAEEEVGKDKNEGGIGKTREGRYTLRTNRDKQDHVAKPKGRKKLEENVNDFGILVLLLLTFLTLHFFPFFKLYG